MPGSRPHHREAEQVAPLHGDIDAAVVAAKIVSELCKPYLDLDGHDIQASPSIGVALFPRDGHDTDALCRNADTAMYQSKRAGRGRYTFYDASLNPADARLFNLAQRLPRAIAEDELVEITPKNIRIRKRFLKEHERKRASRDAA